MSVAMELAMWAGCGYWGYYVGKGKGKAIPGLVLGIALAFIGVAIVYLMPPHRKRHPTRAVPPMPPFNEPPADWWPPQDPRGKHARSLAAQKREIPRRV